MATPTTGVRGARLTQAAGWTALTFGAVHMLVTPWDTRAVWSAALSDGWWNSFTLNVSTTFAAAKQSEAFWLTLGSFGVPMILTGALVVRAARRDERVPEAIGWGTLAWGILLTTSLPASPGWALPVIGGLLIAGDRLRRRAAGE
ncbi:hypothetical protein HPO96_12755 [Kribbella sandramycini]|uniref:Uncharacterized protein n=1 Tax=Kribbella sandramycini TaxID=60450 RepID=A0A7Y4KYN8_9ACTN|nr:DUF6463 family protein [Kribbella sandramycini]MBB6569042.1 hypothetical protein [Kribbella sandramycini]NOL41114.1 hypothetical protein [Kribbella sandramycini]